MLPTPDLNCDLGEDEAPARTAALIRLVDSANIACGGHAGEDHRMRACLRLAAELGVRAGAHPGLPSRTDFGRGDPGTVTPGLLAALLRAQVGTLAGHAASMGIPLHHLKLHGALYHAVEGDPRLARSLVETVGASWPGLVVFGRSGGAVLPEAARAGLPAWAEAFLDRAYQDDGQLVPRHRPGAVLDDPAEVVRRLRDLRERGALRTVTGNWLALSPRTLCVHGDSPAALDVLAAVRGEMPKPAGPMP